MKLADCKSAFNLLVVYSTDRSKALVPVLVLLFVALWFILRGDLFLSLALCYSVLVFSSPFSIAITSLREEIASLSAFRTFVQFALVWFCLFPLPPWTFLLLFCLEKMFNRDKPTISTALSTSFRKSYLFGALRRRSKFTIFCHDLIQKRVREKS